MLPILKSIMPGKTTNAWNPQQMEKLSITPAAEVSGLEIPKATPGKLNPVKLSQLNDSSNGTCSVEQVPFVV